MSDGYRYLTHQEIRDIVLTVRAARGTTKRAPTGILQELARKYHKTDLAIGNIVWLVEHPESPKRGENGLAGMTDRERAYYLGQCETWEEEPEPVQAPLPAAPEIEPEPESDDGRAVLFDILTAIQKGNELLAPMAAVWCPEAVP